MANYAIVVDGVVQNIVVWDGATDWAPPQGAISVQSDTAMIGDTYVDGVFSSPQVTTA